MGYQDSKRKRMRVQGTEDRAKSMTSGDRSASSRGNFLYSSHGLAGPVGLFSQSLHLSPESPQILLTYLGSYLLALGMIF